MINTNNLKQGDLIQYCIYDDFPNIAIILDIVKDAKNEMIIKLLSDCYGVCHIHISFFESIFVL